MTSTHSSPIPVPPILEKNAEKFEAFCRGWTAGNNKQPAQRASDWEHANPDATELVRNAFYWGYYSALNLTEVKVDKPHKKAKPEIIEEVDEVDEEKSEFTHECNIGERHQLTLDDIYERLHRNWCFIPNWAWSDDEDLSDLYAG